MILIVEKETDPRHNLAREEYLTDHMNEDIVYLWRNSPSVIVGRHQNTSAEVDESFAEKAAIAVVRRLTGGGAVFQDLGNINISFLFRGMSFEEKAQHGLDLLIEFLGQRGISVKPAGRNDLCVKKEDGSEAKIAGTAMLQRNDRCIFHACLLYDCDLSTMERVLTPPAEKLESKGIRSVRARVTNIRELTDGGEAIDSEAFFRQMADFFAGHCSALTSPAAGEEEAVRHLMRERYQSWEWNFGRNPQSSLSAGFRFPAGQIQVDLCLEKGKIKECRFSGDYLDSEGLTQLSSRLKGIPYRKGEVETTVEDMDLQSLFGLADREKIVHFLMGGEV